MNLDTAASVEQEELLKPGALYSECAVVRLQVPIQEDSEKSFPDDGELGGEVVGRKVWESLEEMQEEEEEKK